MLAVSDRECSARVIKFETMPRDLHRTRSEIDAGATCATARKLQQVGAHAATDFEQTRAAKLIEAHDARHPRRVLGIAMLLDRVEKLAGAELVFAVKLRATRILSPLLPRPNFFLSQHVNFSFSPGFSPVAIRMAARKPFKRFPGRAWAQHPAEAG